MDNINYREIYEKFLNDYKDDSSIVSSNNINEYFLLKRRIVSLYENSRYSEFLDNLSTFTHDIVNPSEKTYRILNDYMNDTKEGIYYKLEQLENDNSLSNTAHSIVKNMKELIESNMYVFDVKLELFWSYLNVLESMNIDVFNLRNNINTYFYIDKTIKNNILNKEKEKVVEMSVSGRSAKVRDITLVQNAYDKKTAENSINSDINAISEIVSSNIETTNTTSINDEEKELVNEASDVLGYKIELTEEAFDKITGNQRKIVDATLNTNSLASKIIKIKSSLNNLNLFSLFSKEKLVQSSDEISKKIDYMIESATKELESTKNEYVALKNNEKSIQEQLKKDRKEMRFNLEDTSIKKTNADLIKKSGIKNAINFFKNTKDKITSKLSNKRNSSKLKRKATAIIAAAVVAFSGQSQNIQNIANSIINDSNEQYIQEVESNSEYDISLDVYFGNDISEVIEKIKKCDDKEIQDYINIIEKLNINSNTKGEVKDSMLYALGLCATNWSENCKVFNVDESWNDRIEKLINTVGGVSSISLVSNESAGWRGITNYKTNSGNLSDMTIQLNEFNHGNITSLIHEGVHTEQKKFRTSNDIRDAIGDMPNPTQIVHFLEEGEACFIQGLARTKFLVNGFDSYNDIEGQTFGLILIVGSNEYMNFISGDSDETFTDFVRRRFIEQGYTREYANNYLIALQNANIGTLNSYSSSVSESSLQNTSDFAKKANASYNQELANFKNNPTKTFESNYNKLSNIVENVLKDRLRKSKNSNDLIEALYGLGVYHDHIVANYVLYANDDTLTEGVASDVGTAVYANEDKETIRQEKFNSIYKEMYGACKDVVNNFILPYNKFVDIFKKEGNATDIIDTVELYNEQYTWEKQNNVFELKDKIGDLPNVISMSNFLSEGSKLFNDGIKYETIKNVDNKGITPVYIGLGLVTGFDDLEKYINKNEKNESLEEFINRRCEEQGFSENSSYIVALQNSLIGRFDHNVNLRTNSVETSYGALREARYKNAINNKTTQDNYQYYEDIVFKMMQKKLQNAKTDDQKLEAFEYLGIYLDYISGNEIHYDENFKSLKNSKTNRNASKKDDFSKVSELMYSIYDSIDGNDEMISFEEFVDIFNKSGKATTYFDNLSKKTSKNNTNVEKETKIDNKQQIETKSNTKITEEKTQSISNTLTKSQVLSDAKKYLDVLLEYQVYPKELIYGFTDRFTNFVDQNKITVDEANQILNDIKSGKITMSRALWKFSLMDRNNVQSNTEKNTIEQSNKGKSR